MRFLNMHSNGDVVLFRGSPPLPEKSRERVALFWCDMTLAVALGPEDSPGDKEKTTVLLTLVNFVGDKTEYEAEVTRDRVPVACSTNAPSDALTTVSFALYDLRPVSK